MSNLTKVYLSTISLSLHEWLALEATLRLGSPGAAQAELDYLHTNLRTLYASIRAKTGYHTIEQVLAAVKTQGLPPKP